MDEQMLLWKQKTTKQLVGPSGLLPDNVFVIVFVWFGGGITLGRGGGIGD